MLAFSTVSRDCKDLRKESVKTTAEPRTSSKTSNHQHSIKETRKQRIRRQHSHQRPVISHQRPANAHQLLHQRRSPQSRRTKARRLWQSHHQAKQWSWLIKKDKQHHPRAQKEARISPLSYPAHPQARLQRPKAQKKRQTTHQLRMLVLLRRRQLIFLKTEYL